MHHNTQQSVELLECEFATRVRECRVALPFITEDRELRDRATHRIADLSCHLISRYSDELGLAGIQAEWRLTDILDRAEKDAANARMECGRERPRTEQWMTAAVQQAVLRLTSVAFADESLPGSRAAVLRELARGYQEQAAGSILWRIVRGFMVEFLRQTESEFPMCNHDGGKRPASAQAWTSRTASERHDACYPALVHAAASLRTIHEHAAAKEGLDRRITFEALDTIIRCSIDTFSDLYTLTDVTRPARASVGNSKRDLLRMAFPKAAREKCRLSVAGNVLNEENATSAPDLVPAGFGRSSHALFTSEKLAELSVRRAARLLGGELFLAHKNVADRLGAGRLKDDILTTRALNQTVGALQGWMAALSSSLPRSIREGVSFRQILGNIASELRPGQWEDSRWFSRHWMESLDASWKHLSHSGLLCEKSSAEDFQGESAVHVVEFPLIRVLKIQPFGSGQLVDRLLPEIASRWNELSEDGGTAFDGSEASVIAVVNGFKTVHAVATVLGPRIEPPETVLRSVQAGLLPMESKDRGTGFAQLLEPESFGRSSQPRLPLDSLLRLTAESAVLLGAQRLVAEIPSSYEDQEGSYKLSGWQRSGQNRLAGQRTEFLCSSLLDVKDSDATTAPSQGATEVRFSGNPFDRTFSLADPAGAHTYKGGYEAASRFVEEVLRDGSVIGFDGEASDGRAVVTIIYRNGHYSFFQARNEFDLWEVYFDPGRPVVPFQEGLKLMRQQLFPSRTLRRRGYLAATCEY